MRPGEKWFAIRSFQYVEDGKVLTMFDPSDYDMKESDYPIVRVVDETGAQVVACHDLATISEARAAEITALPELARLARRLALQVASEYAKGDLAVADAVAVREILVRLGVWPANENVEGLVQ